MYKQCLCTNHVQHEKHDLKPKYLGFEKHSWVVEGVELGGNSSLKRTGSEQN